jgi:hypothetical protein
MESKPRKRRQIICGYCKSVILFTSKERHFERKHPAKPLFWTEKNADEVKPMTDIFRPKRAAKEDEFVAQSAAIGSGDKDVTIVDEEPEVAAPPLSPSRVLSLPRPQNVDTPKQPIIVTGAFSTVQVSPVNFTKSQNKIILHALQISYTFHRGKIFLQNLLAFILPPFLQNLSRLCEILVSIFTKMMLISSFLFRGQFSRLYCFTFVQNFVDHLGSIFAEFCR